VNGAFPIHTDRGTSLVPVCGGVEVLLWFGFVIVPVAPPVAPSQLSSLNAVIENIKPL
jgi:hypothetical protein